MRKSDLSQISRVIVFLDFEAGQLLLALVQTRAQPLAVDPELLHAGIIFLSFSSKTCQNLIYIQCIFHPDQNGQISAELD